jgi:hypothetical protein
MMIGRQIHFSFLLAYQQMTVDVVVPFNVSILLKFHQQYSNARKSGRMKKLE